MSEKFNKKKKCIMKNVEMLSLFKKIILILFYKQNSKRGYLFGAVMESARELKILVI